MNALNPLNALVPVGTPADAPPPDPGELRRVELRERLAACKKPLAEKAKRMIEIWCTNGGNATAAYREAYDVNGRSAHHVTDARDVMNRPGVQEYIRELRAVAAERASIDVQALLEADRAIVEAADHAANISSYRISCCRHCHGKDHAYQWRDDAEYSLAMCAVFDFNASAPEAKARSLPSDEGGYGYDPSVSPVPTCTKCDGKGLQEAVFADTEDYGKAMPLFKGVKIGKNGVEVLLHDVDKAKERLLRAAGAFGDDAASVARGAAAGAAIGASAAAAVASKAKDMSADELRKAYLTLVG